MAAFIQKTNRNSFTLRFKKYKILRFDFWGRIALSNRKNKISHYLKYFAMRDTNIRLKFLPRKKQKNIRRSLNILRKYKPRLFSPSKSISKQALQGKTTRRPKELTLSRRSATKNLKQIFRFFYGLPFRRKSLRKFFSGRKSQIITDLELRIDTILYRCNFFQTIPEARKFLNFVRIINKKKRINFVCQRRRLKPNTQIAPYQMILLTPALASKRKAVLLNQILSGNKLHVCRYSHFLINFKLLAIILIKMPTPSQIKYPFTNKPFTKFLGVARYL